MRLALLALALLLTSSCAHTGSLRSLELTHPPLDHSGRHSCGPQGEALPRMSGTDI